MLKESVTEVRMYKTSVHRNSIQTDDNVHVLHTLNSFSLILRSALTYIYMYTKSFLYTLKNTLMMGADKPVIPGELINSHQREYA